MAVTIEQFMLGKVIAGAIIAANPPFCGEGVGPDDSAEAVNSQPGYVRNVAEVVADTIENSQMMLEDFELILADVRCVLEARQADRPKHATVCSPR